MTAKPSTAEELAHRNAIGFLRYASEFLEAALAADDKMGKKEGYEIIAPIPVLFLVGQSIELALKAFLLWNGVEMRKLKQQELGHGLHRCLRKAKELGLFEVVTLSAEDIAVIVVLDDLYSSKQLQYIETGMKTFPVFGPLESIARRLVHSIGKKLGFHPRHLSRVL